ncbi:hypothetical protein BaRGS_00027007, partial [Batillaria attramentaria]
AVAFWLLPGQPRPVLQLPGARARRRQAPRFLRIRVTGLPATHLNAAGINQRILAQYQRLGLGKVNGGNPVQFPMAMTEEDFEVRLRQLLPGLENMEFELCVHGGRNGMGNQLHAIPYRTPRTIHANMAGRRSALYVRLKADLPIVQDPLPELEAPVAELPVVQEPLPELEAPVAELPVVQGHLPEPRATVAEVAEEEMEEPQPRPPFVDMGTPTVESRNRAELRREQNREFAETQQIDHAREMAQRHAQQQRRRLQLQRREHRQRHRNQREQAVADMANRIAEVPEPDSGIEIGFRLPDGSRVTRSFAADAPVQALFDYIGGVHGIPGARLLNPAREELTRAATIASLGVQGRTLITVENDMESNASSSDESVPIQDDAIDNPVVLDLPSFKRRVFEHSQALHGTVKLQLSRDTVLEDMTTVYGGNPNIIHSYLDVTFKGEEGADVDGPTKECLRLFWEELF